MPARNAESILRSALTHEPGIAYDAKRLDSYFADMRCDEALEVVLLVAAALAGTPATLLADKQKGKATPTDVWIKRLTSGTVTGKQAEWSLRTWASALGAELEEPVAPSVTHPSRAAPAAKAKPAPAQASPPAQHEPRPQATVPIPRPNPAATRAAQTSTYRPHHLRAFVETLGVLLVIAGLLAAGMYFGQIPGPLNAKPGRALKAAVANGDDSAVYDMLSPELKAVLATQTADGTAGRLNLLVGGVAQLAIWRSEETSSVRLSPRGVATPEILLENTPAGWRMTKLITSVDSTSSLTYSAPAVEQKTSLLAKGSTFESLPGSSGRLVLRVRDVYTNCVATDHQIMSGSQVTTAVAPYHWVGTGTSKVQGASGITFGTSVTTQDLRIRGTKTKYRASKDPIVVGWEVAAGKKGRKVSAAFLGPYGISRTLGTTTLPNSNGYIFSHDIGTLPIPGRYLLVVHIGGRYSSGGYFTVIDP